MRKRKQGQSRPGVGIGSKKRTEEADYFAVSAAEFKVEEAHFFLDKAASAIASAREFRFYFDAALDATISARCIAKAVVARDRALSKLFKKRLDQFSREESTKLINDSRVDAHHLYKRAPLCGIIEAPSRLVRDVSGDDHVEYKIAIDADSPKQRLTWTLRKGDHYCDALEACYQVLLELGPIIADIRARFGLKPSKGLKRISMQILRGMKLPEPPPDRTRYGREKPNRGNVYDLLIQETDRDADK